MLKLLRAPKGLMTLVVMVILIAACSTPKYYVFKTIKHTPVEKSEAAQEEKAVAKNEAAQDFNQADADNQEMAMASVEKAAVPVNLEKINRDMAEKAVVNHVKQEKVSKFEQVKTALQIKKELKKIEKEQNTAQDPVAEGKGKSQFIALLLAILAGAFGIHRFYLGYTTIGIIQLLTLGGCGVWALIDLIRIAMGDLKPVDGDYEETL